MVWSVTIDGTQRQVLGLAFQTGSERSANPQRPTGQWGRGRVSVLGYRTQTRKRLKIAVGGTDRVDAWVQNEQYDDQTDISTYDVVGLLSLPARDRSTVSQGALTADANQSSIINKMRDAFGVSAIQSSLPSTPLSLYRFEGPAGGYASRFGLVAGGLPYATQMGLLGIKDPTRVPNTLNGTFGSSTHRVRDIRSIFESDQLWNNATLVYEARSDQSVTITHGTTSRPSGYPSSHSGWVSVTSSTSSYPRSETVDIELAANQQIVGGADGINVTFMPLFAAGRSGSTIVSNAAAVSAIQFSADVALAGSRITITLAERPSSPGTWGSGYTSDGTRQSFNLGSTWYPGSLTNSPRVTNVYGYYQLSYTVRTTQDPVTLMPSNDESINEWGSRTLDLPLWFAPTASTAVQARIDALAKVRNLRVVDFYVDQRDVTKTSAVAAIEPGHYIALSDVGTIVYVMNVEWRLSSRNSAIKRVTCIDTGTDHTPTVPTNALTWRSDEVTWRTQYLEWSRA